MAPPFPPDDADRILVVPTERFAESAAERIARELRQSLARHGRATLALAGGNTPKPVYQRLAKGLALPWSRVEIFFGDERAVAPDDPASNYRMAKESLLDLLPEAPVAVHRMLAEGSDPAAVAETYADLLPEAFDLVLLGIGEDGHTASLFPGSPALDEESRRVLPVIGSKPPPQRFTITPPVLRAARRTLVLAKGAGKATAVARALQGPDDFSTCPAQLVRQGLWLLDEAAASLLHRSQT